MNLSQIVTIQNSADPSAANKNTKTVTKINELINNMDSFLESCYKLNAPSNSIDFITIYDSVKRDIEKARKENNSIALTLSNKNDFIFDISMERKYTSAGHMYVLSEKKSFFNAKDFNRANVEEIRELANKLGLLIIPYNYTSSDVLKHDRIPCKKSYYGHLNANDVVNSFNNKCKDENLKAWLVCPLKYYNISSHANNTSFNFFVPDSVSQAFNAVKLIMPMLISMSKQIEQVSGEVKHLQSQVNTLQEQLKEQQRQIDNLQIEITRIQKKQAEEEARRDAEFKALMDAQQQQQQIQWDVFDPMLIAIPNDVTDINTYNGRCFIGPAWGPEIDTVLLKLHGINKNKASASHNDSVIEKFK